MINNYERIFKAAMKDVVTIVRRVTIDMGSIVVKGVQHKQLWLGSRAQFTRKL